MLLLDLAAKRAWHKINFSNSESGLVQNQFHWLTAFQKRIKTIPITGFVPPNLCRVLLGIQPSRQNRQSDSSQQRGFGAACDVSNLPPFSRSIKKKESACLGDQTRMPFSSSAVLLAVILEATTAGTHAFATPPADRLVSMHRRHSPRRGQPRMKGTASDPASKRVRLETGDVVGVVAQHANQVSISSHLDQSKAFSEGLLGLVASFVISLAVLAIALVSPFVTDGEAMVARCIPTRLAHFLRDRWQSWAVFNRWTWALVAPGLALTRFDLLRQLLEKHGQDLDVPYNDCSHAREIPSAARRTLDIFYHGEPTESALRPVVVFVHGGAWSHGSKVR